MNEMKCLEAPPILIRVGYVSELSPLLVHKRRISYLHQSVKWNVYRLSSAI